MTRSESLSVHLVAGARPNFMKIAPLYHVLSSEAWCDPRIVHTGQHYDANMSDAFFQDLSLPEPHYNLAVGSGRHGEQTAAVMVAYEELCEAQRPAWTVVVGDVNSTMACALVGVKAGIRVAHLEAGLRSYDRSMPEEINRIVTDSVSDLLWTPSEDGDENLLREGIPRERIDRVGNIMIDSFELLAPKIRALDVATELGLERGGYVVVTLHRPSNVDDPEKLQLIVDSLRRIGRRYTVVFPVHPRTRARLEAAGLLESLKASDSVRLIDPLGYVSFMNLVLSCRLVVTDSGGVQEETSYLGIPCLTLRDNTERPITVARGTNKLIDCESLEAEANRLFDAPKPEPSRIELWDGATAGRVARSLKRHAGLG